ncbi:MAG: hypothetical protein GX542_02690, partial [Rhodococcus sp.]|nr:hypothetical protein [Rhodococcus sp. (in: high G+C Gram-positive bacteria)]
MSVVDTAGIDVAVSVDLLAQQRDPLLIGVRHHSPTLARVIESLLDEARPQVL